MRGCRERNSEGGKESRGVQLREGLSKLREDGFTLRGALGLKREAPKAEVREGCCWVGAGQVKPRAEEMGVVRVGAQ